MTSHYALFGGSFNPLHQGHVQIVRQLQKTDVNGIIIMPTSRSPFKPTQRLLPNDIRLKMITHTFEGWERVVISDLEIRHQNIRYTYHTLQQLSQQFAEGVWHIVIGIDAYRAFPLWKNAKELLQKASLWVVHRFSKSDSENQENTITQVLDQTGWFNSLTWNDTQQVLYHKNQELVRLFDFQTPDISATQIREGHLGIEWIPPSARSIYIDYLSTVNTSSEALVS